MPTFRQRTFHFMHAPRNQVLRAARKVKSKHPNLSKAERREQMEKFLDAEWHRRFLNASQYVKRQKVNDEADARAIDEYVRVLDALGDAGMRSRWKAVVALGQREMGSNPTKTDFHGLPIFARHPNKSFPYIAYAALRDPDPHLRLRALMRLQIIDHPATFAVLQYAVNKEKHPDVRITAIESMRHYNTDQARATLFRTLSQKEPRYTSAVLETLGIIGTPVTAAQLFKITLRKDATPLLRKNVYRAIRDIALRQSTVFETMVNYPLRLSRMQEQAIMVYTMLSPKLRDMKPFDLADHLFEFERKIKKHGMQPFLESKRLSAVKLPY